MVSSHDMDILGQVARLFRAFPSGKNVDEHTLQDYCEAFADFELITIAHVVDRFRLGEVKRESHAFPPALAEVMTHMRKRCTFIRMQRKHAELGPGNRPKRINYILPKTHFLNRHTSDQKEKI